MFIRKKGKLKILFIQELWYWHMGIMYLSAIAKQFGHSVQLILQDSPKKMFKNIMKYNPDIIAFSVLTGSHKYIEDWARILKPQLNALIVAGNVHVTILPEFIQKPGIDVICRGEGEIAFKELLYRMERGEELDNTPNLWIKKANGEIIKNDDMLCIENLDSIPFADRSLYFDYPFFKYKKQASLTSNRGCPYRCTFCLSPKLRKFHNCHSHEYLRRRSVDNLIEEALILKREINPSIIHFHDDIFILDKEWLSEFAEKWNSLVNIPYYCGGRSDSIDDEIASLLHKSQCKLFFMGVESGDEQIRQKLLAKNISDEQLFRAVDILNRNHVPLQTLNILNLPGETLEQFQKTVEINYRMNPTIAFGSLFTPYPGSSLTDYCLKHGYISEDYVDKILPTFFSRSILNPEKQKNVFYLNKMHKIFLLLIRKPSLLPLAMKVAKVLPQIFFEMVFLLTEIFRLVFIHKLSIKDVIYTGLKSLKMYRGKNLKKLKPDMLSHNKELFNATTVQRPKSKRRKPQVHNIYK